MAAFGFEPNHLKSMRVLFGSCAIALLVLLASAAAVYAGDGQLVADPLAGATNPVDPTTTVTEPIVDTTKTATGPVLDTTSIVTGPVGDAVAPIVDPVVDVVTPVATPIVDVVEPIGAPIVEVVEPVVDPVLDPVAEVIDPITGPMVDVVEPILDPVIDAVEPITPPIIGLVDPTQPDGATGLSSDAVGVPPWDIAGSIVATSWMTDPGWTPFGSDSATADTRPVSVTSDPPTLNTPAGLPRQGAPLLPLSDVAGTGPSLSPGASIALLIAGLLAIVFHAFRRPWSSVPILRGRSLLPAVPPA